MLLSLVDFCSKDREYFNNCDSRVLFLMARIFPKSFKIISSDLGGLISNRFKCFQLHIVPKFKIPCMLYVYGGPRLNLVLNHVYMQLQIYANSTEISGKDYLYALEVMQPSKDWDKKFGLMCQPRGLGEEGLL